MQPLHPRITADLIMWEALLVIWIQSETLSDLPAVSQSNTHTVTHALVCRHRTSLQRVSLLPKVIVEEADLQEGFSVVIDEFCRHSNKASTHHKHFLTNRYYHCMPLSSAFCLKSGSILILKVPSFKIMEILQGHAPNHAPSPHPPT